MARFTVLAMGVAAGCSNKQPAPAPTQPLDAAVFVAPAPPSDASPIARIPTARTTDANGWLAVAKQREGQDSTIVEVHGIVGGTIERASTIEIPGPELFNPMLAWPARGPLVVGGNPMGAPSWTFGTIVDGNYTRAATHNHRGALTGQDDMWMIVTDRAEVWLEQCVWDAESPEEEGCEKRVYHRIFPEPGKATKRPAAAALPAPIAGPSNVTLAARNLGDRFVLDCTIGEKLTTLLDEDQIASKPTWRWLSADPPISLLALHHSGLDGRGVPTPTMLRGCVLDKNSERNVMLGPDGLWAERVDSVHPAGGVPRFHVYRRGVMLGTVEGLELVFAGGSTPDLKAVVGSRGGALS